MKRFFCGALALAMLGGCASSSQNVTAASVSTTGYEAWDCNRLQTERELLKTKVVEVSRAQDEKAQNDSVAVAAGAILFLPLIAFVAAGDDREGELSRLKGEFEAVTTVAADKDCISPEELAKEREEALAAEKARREAEAAQQAQRDQP